MRRQVGLISPHARPEDGDRTRSGRGLQVAFRKASETPYSLILFLVEIVDNMRRKILVGAIARCPVRE